ncbi:MAG: hypothetical protein U0V02_17435 [Anaerolineales bacterium]
MRRRIPLPSYERKPGSPVHPFPYQISMRALDLLQGATFYPAFVDVAVGLFKDNTPNFLDHLQQAFISNGMSQSTWNISIDSLTNYLTYLPNPVMQVAMIEGLSHWDWYVGKLGKFIEFARQHDPRPVMAKKLESNLPLIALCSFTDQISILKAASDNMLQVPESSLSEIAEMVLVRNLGVHSQWEVTAYYLKNTKTTGWTLGDVRDIEVSEFEGWRMALYNLINDTARHFANMYSKVPDFDPYKIS